MKTFTLTLMLSLFSLFISPADIEAGPTLCQRMHSCPATDGSYVCGDRGRCSKCPDNLYCQGGKSRSEQKSVPESSSDAPSEEPPEKGQVKVGDAGSRKMQKGLDKMGEALGKGMAEGMEKMGEAMAKGMAKAMGEGGMFGGMGELMKIAQENEPDPKKAKYANKGEEVTDKLKRYLLGIFMMCHMQFLMQGFETCSKENLKKPSPKFKGTNVKESMTIDKEGKKKWKDYVYKVDPEKNTPNNFLIRGYHKEIGEVWEINHEGKSSLKKSANQERM